MDKKEYDYANLSNTTLEQIRSLEQTLREEAGEEIILIAYQNQPNH